MAKKDRMKNKIQWHLLRQIYFREVPKKLLFFFEILYINHNVKINPLLINKLFINLNIY